MTAISLANVPVYFRELIEKASGSVPPGRIERSDRPWKRVPHPPRALMFNALFPSFLISKAHSILSPCHTGGTVTSGSAQLHCGASFPAGAAVMSR
jgi:hypothetical protein